VTVAKSSVNSSITMEKADVSSAAAAMADNILRARLTVVNVTAS